MKETSDLLFLQSKGEEKQFWLQPTQFYSATFIFLIFFLAIFTSVGAQDLGNLKNEKPVDFSGNISLRLNTYASSRENPTRDPFFWTISGSPTVSIYGLSLPFSFAFSQKNKDFRQPFNQFGVSPYYKWLKIHLGYRSLSFSDYTLSNHTFLGAGIEADPSIFRLGFMYGRFLKAIEQPIDTLAEEIIRPAFSRTGWAAKVGIGTNNNFLDLIVFKGRDNVNSLTDSLASVAVAAENLVYGIKSRQVFLKIFSFDLDYGFSSYTHNRNSERIDTEQYRIPFFVTGLLTPNASTEFTMAGKASLNMRLKLLQLRLQYSRVEPDYQSMGSYFLNNDMENITIAPSWSMFKSKVRINGSVGFQRNNLFNDKLNKTLRRISSVNISYTPTGKFGVNAFYTNYRINQERNIRTSYDTLKLEQFSHNLNFNTFLNLGNKDIRHTVNLGLNYQTFLDDNNMSEVNSNTTSINPNLSYRFSNNPNKFGINANINVNKFETAQNATVRWGYSFGVNKRFLENKLSLNGSLSYFINRMDGQKHSNTMSLNARGNYNINKHHSLYLSGNFITRSAVSDDIKAIRDLLANLGYTFNF
ncbi:MAG TPA: hypothetical protein VD908_18570 [Cytophagales bacterium]|nr:hypothetical protein [Cytophagales bacterium]